MNRNFVFKFVTLVLCLILATGCAYKLSNKVDRFPGDIQTVQVPVFSNVSREPNVEVFFTDALKDEVLRFGRVKLVNEASAAEGILTGIIHSVELKSDESVTEAKNTQFLPYGSVLSAIVRVTVNVTVTLTDKKTQKILWSANYTNSKNYTPPQITLPVINSANNLYNLSERRQTLESISKDMMQLALDRLFDNF